MGGFWIKDLVNTETRLNMEPDGLIHTFRPHFVENIEEHNLPPTLLLLGEFILR